MQFKRNEAFRLSFEPPIDVTFSVVRSNQNDQGNRELLIGKILDISPRGMKIFTDAQITDFVSGIIKANFVLDTSMIQAYGEIVWKKPFANGFQYGIQFNGQKSVEELIVSELKLRRKKEVIAAKRKIQL